MLLVANSLGSVNIVITVKSEETDGALGDLAMEPNEDMDDADKNKNKKRRDAIQYACGGGAERRKKRGQNKAKRLLSGAILL